MIRLGLRGRLLVTYLILVTLGVGGLVIRFGLLERGRVIDETEHELELQAFVLGAALDPSIEKLAEGELSYPQFGQTIAHLTQNLDARLTVLTLYGEPIYDSAEDFRVIPNQFDQAEVQFALQNSELHQIRLDPLTGEERLYAAAPISHEGDMRGVVQLSTPAAPMRAKIRQSWLILSGTALIILSAVTAASLWLANYILRPLKTMQEAATHLAAGDLNQHINTPGNDELADLARAFNHMAAQLKDMILRQQQFVANASHELRTPLTNIKLRAEALLNGARDDSVVAEKFITDIEHEADRMEHLTGNLLTLSRMDASQAPTHMKPLDMGALLAEIVATLQPLAHARQVRLTLDAPHSLPPVLANDPQLRQVFDNLLSNALKFTPPGGSIAVTARQTAAELLITVADTGQGIPPADLPHIFERFYRVDKARTRTTDPGGSGLGLSIVQSIIKNHSGQINVSSQPGKGTIFSLRFPLAATQLPPPNPPTG
ncbi:MAG: sensor histidine kinase [Anaerolineae bacterium]